MPGHRRIRLGGLLIGLLALAACAGDDPLSSPANDNRSFPVTPVPERMEFTQWSDTAFSATSLAFMPDGRALAITKGGFAGPGVGHVKLLDTDGTFIWDVGQIPVCTDAERGLLGIAIDPDYLTNRHIYLYYTRAMSGCALGEADTAPVWNRVSRFVLADDGIDMSTETVLVDEIPGHQSSHNAGDLEFLPDGTLLVATGEASLPGPPDPGQLNGKILRLDLDAPDLVPADNPFADRGPPAGLVYATGFRNPFRIAVRPDGTILAADVGLETFEEINIVESGADYGWPESEGPDTQAGSTPPAAWYRHTPECASAIIGGDFAEPGSIPGTTTSAFVFADFGCGTITALELDGDEVGRGITLASFDDSPADVVTGPDGAIYLVRVGPGDLPILRLGRR